MRSAIPPSGLTPPRTRPERTYVVVGLALPFGPDTACRVLGTVRAPTRHAARPLAFTLAFWRAPALLSPTVARRWAVRHWTVSACRRAWLAEALARDGHALRVAARA